MKANELSCRDLMVGDWVYLPSLMSDDKYPIQVLEIQDDCIKYYCGDKKMMVGFRYIKPVPITLEILEKNGFKPYIPEGHLETVYACQDISKAVADELYALWPNPDGSFYLLLRVDGKDMVRMNVHYVHKFQHALGLCEIDKNIEL